MDHIRYFIIVGLKHDHYLHNQQFNSFIFLISSEAPQKSCYLENESKKKFSYQCSCTLYVATNTIYAPLLIDSLSLFFFRSHTIAEERAFNCFGLFISNVRVTPFASTKTWQTEKQQKVFSVAGRTNHKKYDIVQRRLVVDSTRRRYRS